MKISLNWIKEFTDIKLPVEELVAKIGAQLGEVEEVMNLGERYSGIVVAKVVSCEKHPNADRLNICKIDDGNTVKDVQRDENGYVQVVCGAPNVRAGITVAWIPPGCIVPSSYDREQFTLETRELRGVTSNGMLASGQELAINDDHDGILILDKPCSPGDELAKVYQLDDYIIDVENKMFTHRPDCFGQLGVAREIAGIQNIKFTSPDWYLKTLDVFKPESETQLKLEVKNELPDLAPRFMAVPMSGITVTKSPIMIQSFLSRVGIKPINNVVDITNFVMMLTAQPLHAYDYDKLAALDDSKTATITVRKPKKGEKLVLLNGKTVEPRKEAIMIASANRLVGVGGIMGGTSTEVDVDTKNIVLECANFDMYSIRRTSMAHGLFTDAVTRFNKGQSPLQTDRVLAYAVAWVKKLAGGAVAGQLLDSVDCDKIDTAHDGWNDKEVIVTPLFISERLGLQFTTAQIKKLLSNVEFGFDKTKKEAEIRVLSPFWRTDIEIPEDVVEEVGRLYGYDNLPLELPKRDITPVIRQPILEVKSQIRNVLSAAGANEVLTYSFVHGDLMDKVGQDKKMAYQLSNALSPDLQYYRLSLLPSLLDKVHANIKAGFAEFALFEINKTHDKSNVHDSGLPNEEERLAFVFAADVKAQKQYAGSAYYQARNYLNYLLNNFGYKNLIFEPATTHQPTTDTGKQLLAPFAVNRTAYVKTSEGILLSVIGEFRQTVHKNLKLPAFIAGFELDVDMLKQYQASLPYKPLSRFPKSQQDISLQVSTGISYAQVYSLVDEYLRGISQINKYGYELDPVDIYQKNGAKTRTISLRVSLVSYERTLTTSEVSGVLDGVAKLTKKELGADRI